MSSSRITTPRPPAETRPKGDVQNIRAVVAGSPKVLSDIQDVPFSLRRPHMLKRALPIEMLKEIPFVRLIPT